MLRQHNYTKQWSIESRWRKLLLKSGCWRWMLLRLLLRLLLRWAIGHVLSYCTVVQSSLFVLIFLIQFCLTLVYFSGDCCWDCCWDCGWDCCWDYGWDCCCGGSPPLFATVCMSSLLFTYWAVGLCCISLRSALQINERSSVRKSPKFADHKTWSVIN